MEVTDKSLFVSTSFSNTLILEYELNSKIEL